MIKKDINFFRAYRIEEKRKKSLSNVAAMSSLILAFIVIATLSISGVIVVQMKHMEQEIKDIQAFLTNPSIEGQLKELKTKKEAVDALTRYNEALLAVGDQIEKIPMIDQALFKGIAKVMPKDLKITQISYSRGNMTLNCTTTQKVDIGNFVNSLRAAKEVQQVTYTGYEMKNDTDYEFIVQLTLKAGGEVNENHQ